MEDRSESFSIGDIVTFISDPREPNEKTTGIVTWISVDDDGVTLLEIRFDQYKSATIPWTTATAANPNDKAQWVIEYYKEMDKRHLESQKLGDRYDEMRNEIEEVRKEWAERTTEFNNIWLELRSHVGNYVPWRHIGNRDDLKQMKIIFDEAIEGWRDAQALLDKLNPENHLKKKIEIRAASREYRGGYRAGEEYGRED